MYWVIAMQTHIAYLFVNKNLSRSMKMEIMYDNVKYRPFTPPVFSTFGGLDKEATVFAIAWADILSQIHGTFYNQILS